MSNKEALDEANPPLSPTNRLKFLCSCGGKILPRPSDGQLKYVGGETRVVSVPRSVTFKALSEKISSMFNNGELVIKYQVLPEDLDTLVSVRSDEDLYYMVEEYDLHENLPRSPFSSPRMHSASSSSSSSSPRFRIFLYPNTTTTPDSPSPTYVDAINNCSSRSKFSSWKKGKNLSLSIPVGPSKPSIFTLSSASACTSPTSTVDSGRSSFPGMHRVQSTPNLGASFSQWGNYNNGISPRGAIINNHLHHRHHHHQQQQQQQHKVSGTRWMGCSQHRYEICGCGCGCVLSGHDHPSSRRYYYPPSGGMQYGGHVEESQVLRSGHSTGGSFNFNGTGTPPVVPRKSVWE